MNHLTFTILSLSLMAGSALADPYITESFGGTTANDWSFTTGAGTGPVLTAAQGLDTDGAGWLRLTQDLDSQASFVYNNNAISTAYGIVLQFDYVVWGAESTLGDGFAVALFDATVESPSAGGVGGSLGYAQRYSTGGLDGGVIGFGFDTFGNFSSSEDKKEGGPGKTPRAIAIRGSMGATRTDGYEYITGTGSLDGFASPSTTSRTNATIHSVQITIQTDKKISIDWKTEDDEAWTTLIDEYQCSLDCPDEVMVGFTGGTGSTSANQEIRNLTVSGIPEPAVLTLVALFGVGLISTRRIFHF